MEKCWQVAHTVADHSLDTCLQLASALHCTLMYFGDVKLSKFQREGGDHACCITAAHGIRIYVNLYEEALAHNA